MLTLRVTEEVAADGPFEYDSQSSKADELKKGVRGKPLAIGQHALRAVVIFSSVFVLGFMSYAYVSVFYALCIEPYYVLRVA